MSASYNVHSDSDLVRRLALDDQAAFDALYERYFAALFSYSDAKTGDHYAAQEIVQELFINLWQHRHRLALTGSIKAYLFTSAKHLVIDQYRRTATRNRHQAAFSDHQLLAANLIDEQLEADELQQTYERLLAQLPDKCRRVFSLSRQGYTNAEIANREGIAEKTVEQHITKALRMLRQYLTKSALAMLLFSLFH
ncbi:RNA polymerase sigma-70 factor [Fibrella aquatilis]|uniref:RNA polymerase sigma-70 factor n=1 Tax=Fibrella aquatilis TaxID=2817059 RepID=A0A939K056_9BACT|nr:RNA polymerase sigma-70 factor [Fibrella aquatilis]MBO0933849.1 RNA polymerase sigma-70 factor [Fibrella aquatilis]